MFLCHICQNIDIIAIMNDQKNDFGFHSNRKTQGQKHRLNNLYFKYQVWQMKLRHLNTFLQFRLLFHEPHCIIILYTLFMKLPVCLSVSVSLSVWHSVNPTFCQACTFPLLPLPNLTRLSSCYRSYYLVKLWLLFVL